MSQIPSEITNQVDTNTENPDAMSLKMSSNSKDFESVSIETNEKQIIASLGVTSESTPLRKISLEIKEVNKFGQ